MLGACLAETGSHVRLRQTFCFWVEKRKYSDAPRTWLRSMAFHSRNHCTDAVYKIACYRRAGSCMVLSN